MRMTKDEKEFLNELKKILKEINQKNTGTNKYKGMFSYRNEEKL